MSSVFALAGLASALAAVHLHTSAIGIDDANIFFVYARNFSAGNGFVFNADGERVEGFTSLLWVLAASAATFLAGTPERLLLVANVMLVSATALVAMRPLPGAWAVAFLLLLLSDISYIIWNTVSLMETALWGALLTIAATIAASGRRTPRDSWALAVTSSLLVLTRPEALVWCPALLIVAYLNHPAGTSHAAARRFILPPATLFATTAVALTTFRIVYFGYPLPNTYYAKVSPSLVYRLQQGTGYLASYIGSSPIVFACTVAAAISAAHLLRARARDGRTFALTVLAATGLGVPVLTGGDHFDGFRFYQPIYPLLLLTLLNAVRTIAPQYIPAAIHARVNRRVTLTAAAIALGVCVVLQTVQWLATDRFALLGREFDIATAGRTVGTNANLVFGPDRPSIATITVGGFQYAYHGDVVDLMGLNDTRMAHNGGDRIGIRSHAAFETRTFYELNPAVLLPLVQFHDSLSAVGHRDLFADRVLKGLLAEPQFRSRYQLAEVCRPGAEGAKFVGWFERTLLDRLSTTSGLQVVVADRDYR